MQLLFLILVAPCAYWLLGLPWLLAFRSGGRCRLAPLLGCVLAGWYGEAALMLGIPRAGFTLAALGLSLLATAAFWSRARPILPSALGEGAVLYALALVPATLSPFPVLGQWGGDWLFLFQAGERVLDGGAFPPELLQRPPLFGAAALPLWTVARGLIPYQLMATVASAAMLGAVWDVLARFRGEETLRLNRRWFLAPLVLSPFFLHNTAACWGKLLAGGLVLVALADFWIARRAGETENNAGGRHHWAWGSVWLALAVAVHQSSILYVPLVLVLADWRRPGRAVARLALTALCGVLLVAPYEVWTVARYSLAAKVQANPVVAQRDHGAAGFWSNAGLSLLCTFVGWSPLEALADWARTSHPLAAANVVKKAWWLLTSYLDTLPGTFLGIFLPFLPALRDPEFRRRLRPAGNVALIGAASVVVLFNAVLSPFYSSSGVVQAGLAGIVLVLFTVLLGALAGGGSEAAAAADRRRTRRVCVWTLVLGTVPLLGLYTTVSAGLRFSGRFREMFASASEGDWSQRILPLHLQPFGIAVFPVLPVIALGSLILFAYYSHRRQARKAIEALPPVR